MTVHYKGEGVVTVHYKEEGGACQHMYDIIINLNFHRYFFTQMNVNLWD